MLRGAITAAVTPLADGGRRLDEQAFGPLVRFLAEGGTDGLLACGTTGEGVLLRSTNADARPNVSSRPAPDGFLVAVHAGAQSTADTVELATHAKEIGADAVAVIAPPYFPLDAAAVLDHLRAAAEACARSRSTCTSSPRGPGTRSRSARSNACARRRRTSPA